jgi:hypothetical protein
MSNAALQRGLGGADDAAENRISEWTDYRKKNGLDPLGMQNGSINLYQRLLPGISNVTLRIRYYGLYAWLASVYARREGHTDAAAWQRTIRRAEALYALVASHRQDGFGVAGSRWEPQPVRIDNTFRR